MILLFSAVAARMAQLQVFSSDALADRGDAQRIKTIKLAADRGTIFDLNGYELALSVPQKTIWADPKLVTDVYRTAALLAPLLGRDRADLEELLSSKGR